MAIVVTDQEFMEWKHSRVSQAFFTALNKDREWLKEVLLSGSENDDNIRGRAAAISAILALSYEDLMNTLAEKTND